MFQGAPVFPGVSQSGRSMRATQGRRQQSVWKAPAMLRAAEQFEIVSKLPGRRRYRASSMSEELAALLQQKLSELAFLKEVKVNAATGSLLFVFGPEEAGEDKMDELVSFLRGHIFRPAVVPHQENGLPLEAHAGLLTKSIRGTVRDFSAWIKRNTGGWLDVSSAASLFFMFHGLQKMLVSQQFPSGSQMFWWAVSLMRGWRTV